MSIIIGGKTFPTEDELESKIKALKLSKEDAQATRLDYDRRVFDARVAEQRELHPNVAAAGPVLGAALNYGAGAAPGVAAVTSMLTAPYTAIKRGVGLGDAAELNRAKTERMLGAHSAAQTAGRLASAIAPTPTNVIGRLGYRVAGGALAASAARAPSVTGAAIKQVGAALVGSAGAIGAQNLAEAPGDLATTERTLGDIARDTIEQTTSPLNLTMSTLAGSAAAIPRVAADPATRNLMSRAATFMPSFKPTPDMMRDPSSFMNGMIDALAKTSLGRRVASAYMQERVYNPLKKVVGDLRARYGIQRSGGAAQATADGAEAVRKLIPTEDNPVGELARRRSAIGQTIGRSQATVGTGPMFSIAAAVDHMERKLARGWGSLGPNSSEMSALKAEIKTAAQRTAAGEQAPIEVLENLRQRLGHLAGFEQSMAGGNRGMNAVVNQRDVREAKVLYRAVRESMRKSDSAVDVALRDIAELRSMERSLRQVANTANLRTDQEMVRAVFAAPNFERRWQTLERMLPKDRLQALRGAYLAEFLQDIEITRGYATQGNMLYHLPTMDNAWSGRGSPQYRAQIFDAVLPGLRPQLREYGEISDVVLKSGVGRAEGSATAPREDQVALLNAGFGAIGNAVGIQKDPAALGWTLSILLGAAGRLGLAETMINGRLANVLVKMANQEPVYPGQVAAPAMARAGGPGNVAESLAQITNGLVGATSGAARGLSDLRERALSREERP